MVFSALVFQPHRQHEEQIALALQGQNLHGGEGPAQFNADLIVLGVVQGIESMIPLRWNKKVQVVQFE